MEGRDPEERECPPTSTWGGGEELGPSSASSMNLQLPLNLPLNLPFTSPPAPGPVWWWDPSSPLLLLIGPAEIATSLLLLIRYGYIVHSFYGVKFEVHGALHSSCTYCKVKRSYSSFSLRSTRQSLSTPLLCFFCVSFVLLLTEWLSLKETWLEFFF